MYNMVHSNYFLLIFRPRHHIYYISHTMCVDASAAQAAKVGTTPRVLTRGTSSGETSDAPPKGKGSPKPLMAAAVATVNLRGSDALCQHFAMGATKLLAGQRTLDSTQSTLLSYVLIDSRQRHVSRDRHAMCADDLHSLTCSYVAISPAFMST